MLPDGLGFDAISVARAFAPVAGNTIADRMRLDLHNATPKRVTGTFEDLQKL